jgi:hypothetical protein
MELGYGFFVKMEWPYFFFIVNCNIITYSTPGPNQHIYVLLPVTPPQPGLGRIAEQVQVLVA